MTRHKGVLWALAALAVAAALLWPLRDRIGLDLLATLGLGSRGAGTPAAKTASPVAVRAVRARVDLFEDRVEALGTLRANESVALNAPVSDMISAIHFEDGQRVEKGDILVEMVTAEEKAMLAEAASAAEEAKSQFDRARDLADRNVTSLSLLDQRRREYETAEARKKAIEARIADRILRAPFSGVMGFRNISVGALVDPSKSVARIEDDTVLKLDFSVPSTFIPTLKPGLAIVARATGYEGQQFKGNVATIDSAVDEVTRTIRVRAIIPNPDLQLKPGLLMTIDLFKNQREAIVVPEEALLPAGGQTFVFVVDEAKAKVERRPVTPGQRRPGEVEIKEGLAAGDLVVTEGGLKLAPGTSVNVEEVAPAAADGAEDTPKPAGGRS